MRLISAVCLYSVLSAAMAQTSLLLPRWNAEAKGYKLVALPDGVGADRGPYKTINHESYQRRAKALGATCSQFEKLVWRKEHATIADLSSFAPRYRQDIVLAQSNNVPDTEANRFRSYTFETANPIIVGFWSWSYGIALGGDAEDTLYITYAACLAD